MRHFSNTLITTGLSCLHQSSRVLNDSIQKLMSVERQVRAAKMHLIRVYAEEQPLPAKSAGSANESAMEPHHRVEPA